MTADLDLAGIYRQMLRIREFEERVKATFTEYPGVIRGHTHLADGAEASIAGSLAALRSGDQVLATYRCHGYPLVLGSDPKAMLAEIYGRATGLCGGYGGSMHLADPERGFLGTSGIVGQGIPQATGVAYAAQIRKQGQVVLCFFGDGAKQGAFAEALNVASLWKLPIVYVLENNSFNVVTRVEQEDANAAAGEPLSVKARAFSMPGVTVDGGDPFLVHEAVAGGRGPGSLGRRPDTGGVEDLPAERARQHHRPAGRAAAFSRARGGHRFRRSRGVRGGAARRPAGADAGPAALASPYPAAVTGSGSPRSRRPRRSAWPSVPRWPGTGRWSSCTWPSSCWSRWTRW